ncbi:MAG: PAS domain S-box protein [Oceanidesulfovibrio sp.]
MKSELFDLLSAMGSDDNPERLVDVFLDGLHALFPRLRFTRELDTETGFYFKLSVGVSQAIVVGVTGGVETLSPEDRAILDDAFGIAGRVIASRARDAHPGNGLPEVGGTEAPSPSSQRDRIVQTLLHINERNVLIGRLVDIGFWDYCFHTGVMTWSDTLFKLLGQTPDSLTPSLKNALRAIHPEDRKRLRTEVRTMFRHGGRLECDCRAVLPDGSTRWILVSGAMLSAAWDNQTQLVGVAMDITARKQAQQNLQREEQKYRQLVNNANEWILVSQDGVIRFSNPMVRPILGYEAEELVDKPFEQYILPDDLPMVIENHRNRIAGYAVPNYTFRALARNGETRWLETSGVPCEWEGAPAGLTFLMDVTDQRVAQDALRRSEERLSLALEATKDCIFDWMLEEDSFYVSPRLARILGYNPDEFPSSHLFLMSLVHPQDAPLLEASLKHHIQGRFGAVRSEFRMLRKDGAWCWMLMRCKSVEHDPYGRPVRIVGAFTDVSQRRFAEEGMRDFAQIFSSSPVLMALLDKDFRYRYANPSYRAAFGLKSGEVVGSHARDILGSEAFENQYKELLERCLHGETILFNQSMEYPGLEGERFFNIMYFPHRDIHGKIKGVVIHRSDMTELKQAEDSLKTSEWMLTNIVRDLGVILLSADKDGVINYTAGRGLEDIGITPEEVVGTSIHDRSPAFNAAAKRALAGETFCTEIEHLGEFFNACFNPFRDDQGDVIGLLGVCVSISEQKKAEQALRRAERMEAVGTLAGGIAHDFNNILAAIQNLAFLLRMQTPEHGAARNDLDQIIASTDRGKKLVQQILTFSRKDESSDKNPLCPGVLVNETLKLLRASLPANIDFRFENEAPDAVILANTTNIHQVMLNLCTNASDAMKESGGEILIRLRKAPVAQDDPELHEGEYLVLSVSDSGQGVDPSLGDKIFDPFYTTKALGRGTGLGLSVVHGIMRRHGGVIRYESTPGQGSVFSAYFPLSDMPVRYDDTVASAPRHGAGRILFVDDEAALRDSSRRILEGLGYAVQTAADGQEALELIRDGEFDLVITDMAMPRMTGSQLAQKLRETRPGVPLLLCTGYSDTFGPEDAVQAGMAGYFHKPLDWEQLSKLIADSIGRSVQHGACTGH